jgi:pimeloyl-ACP methyl ester carboxylesterase
MPSATRQLRGRSAFLESHATSYAETVHYSFHYQHAGSGLPIILVHGGGMWLYSFRHITGPLSLSHSVFSLDMPGYGFTVRRDRGSLLNNQAMTAALKEFMECQGLHRACLVGHSWGGGWVLAFALAFPGMVEKIVLIDSSGLDVPDVLEWELLKMPVLGRVFMRFLTPGMVCRRLRRSFHNASLVDEAMAMEVYLPLTIPANQKAQCMLSRNLSWKAVEEGLPVLSRPAMLIWGAQDRYLDVSLAGRLAGKVRDLRVEILQGCGHSPHEEMPGRVTDLIRNFLMPSGISVAG